MKTDRASTEIRAGVISLLMVAIGYLRITGLSNELRVWTFIVLVALCLVLMMKSLVDLFVWAFGLAAAFSGRSLGLAVRAVRSL